MSSDDDPTRRLIRRVFRAVPEFERRASFWCPAPPQDRRSPWREGLWGRRV